MLQARIEFVTWKHPKVFILSFKAFMIFSLTFTTMHIKLVLG